MKKYGWAANEAKLQRALGELGVDAPEEEVKARYVQMAGLLLTNEGAQAPEEPKQMTEEEIAEMKAAKKPKKK